MIGIQNKKMKVIYSDIRNEIISKLENAEELNRIQSVIYGQRQRIGSLRAPAIWIVPNAYVPNFAGAQTANLEIPFDFVAFVKHTDPEEGLMAAQDLALDIYDLLVQDRTLNNLVSDFYPSRIDPAYEAQGANNLFFSAVQFTCRLKKR